MYTSLLATQTLSYVYLDGNWLDHKASAQLHPVTKNPLASRAGGKDFTMGAHDLGSYTQLQYGAGGQCSVTTSCHFTASYNQLQPSRVKLQSVTISYAHLEQEA